MKQGHTILGVDPGFSGALSLLKINPGGIESLDILDMPIAVKSDSPWRSGTKREIDLKALSEWIKGLKGPLDLAVIEDVHSMPNQGLSSTFRFGEGYGIIQGILAYQGVRVIKTPPAVWKAQMGVTKDKNTSLDMAKGLALKDAQHYFSRKKDDGRAEAFLLALFGARSLGCEITRRGSEGEINGLF